jgi:polyisoprenoid-binding protein YceI
MKILSASALIAVVLASAASAAPVKYQLDPEHTYPNFTADHMGGLSTFVGKFKTTSGTVVLDREAGTGSIDVKVDTSSIDFGHDKLNAHARSPEMFDVAKYPTASYTGKLTKFVNGAPTEAEGALTMHGVTKPVTLKIDSFKCKPDPVKKKERCGANASGKINRKDFGVGYGDSYGFDMNTGLSIQVEALRAE